MPYFLTKVSSQLVQTYPFYCTTGFGLSVITPAFKTHLNCRPKALVVGSTPILGRQEEHWYPFGDSLFALMGSLMVNYSHANRVSGMDKDSIVTV